MVHLVLFSVVLLRAFFAVAGAESSTGAFDAAAARTRCTTHHGQSERLYRSTFSWHPSVQAMRETFEEVYASGRRIPYHADYNTEKGSFCLYVCTADGVRPVRITEQFVHSVTLHIETALRQGYAHFVFLPDMGHAHLYFPEEHWRKEYASALSSANHLDELYEKMLADVQMRPLYHLSECLQMRDKDGRVSADPMLRHKYWNRNLLCRNNGTDEHEVVVVADRSRYNTVWALEGYVSWSAGFAMSASRLGCFPYRDGEGRTRYFDISLYDPSCHPSTYLLD
jgi:hypothetical protein